MSNLVQLTPWRYRWRCTLIGHRYGPPTLTSSGSQLLRVFNCGRCGFVRLRCW
jgi:hypothetical protein